MKTRKPSSFKSKKSSGQIQTRSVGTISKKKITQISLECGFEKHKDCDIKATDLILTFVQVMKEKGKSYTDWAEAFSKITGRTVSKQAIAQRMTTPFVEVLENLLLLVTHQQCLKSINSKLFASFDRVLIDDSSSLKLDDVMLKLFRGNASGLGKYAVAKFHIILDVITGQCLLMDLLSFSKNDQSLSSRIFSIAKEGDLIIRDLGFFKLEVLGKMIKQGISVLTRLHASVNLFYSTEGKKLSLLKILGRKQFVDMLILVGSKKVEFRLVALKLPAKVAAERIRKARQNRDKRLNHPKEYYKRLRYEIFLTDVSQDVWDVQDVAEVYCVRWNIEILFKSWKSGLDMEGLMPNDRRNPERTHAILYLLLLYLAWFQHLIFIKYRWQLYEDQKKQLSIIKALKFALKNIEEWFFGEIRPKFNKQLAYFCSYESRGRPNIVECLLGLKVKFS